MKQYKIQYADEASLDLQNIFEFIRDISFEWNAKRVLARIERHIVSFRNFPERDEIIGEISGGRKLRATISGKYRILYYVDKDNGVVQIVRVMHVGRDISKLYK